MAKPQGNVEKLPKWARIYIKDLVRERETAVRTLDEFTNILKPSPISFEAWDNTGEDQGPTHRTFYVQSHSIRIKHKGVALDILCAEDRRSIELQWGDESRSAGSDNICFQPYSTNSARLYNFFHRWHTDPWQVEDYKFWRARNGYETAKDKEGREVPIPGIESGGGGTPAPDQGGDCATDCSGEAGSSTSP